jgi:hypothetical protein
MLLSMVVVHQHLLRDGVLGQLVRLNERSTSVHHACDLILFTDDGGAGIQLLQVVDDCILNVDVSFREHIHRAGSFHHLCEV